MPLQLLSRPTSDAVRARSPSPFATPAAKPQVPTIRLTAATPSEANTSRHVPSVAPWTTGEPASVSIAPKQIAGGQASRKRLVPKKSKLGLLASCSAKERNQDFSDVVRRVGVESVGSGSGGFEIYVDPANDPDIGEILMVKKKKSRVALDGMQWGTLGEVTNVPSVAKPKEKGGKKEKENLLKVKVDENQKWWSIGRGRKDSKEKEKENNKERVKAPEQLENPTDSRARFNSLDSGILLNSPVYTEYPNSPVEYLRVSTPPSATLAPPGAGKGSVAIRAMRSVRSLARIGSWAQLKNGPNPDDVDAPGKEKDPEAKKKKKKKEKEKDKAKQTIRYSGSSFEAGALTASPAGSKVDSKSLGKKKASILGLGLPSTMRLPSSRSGSTASSVVAANTANNRLSVDSAHILGGGILARGRSGSTMSTASSLRPMSTSSCTSRGSSGSSVAASVRWDEAGLQTVKEIRRKDKESRSKDKSQDKSKKCKTGKDSNRKSSDSRKRTPLAAVFPGTLSEREEEEVAQRPVAPIVTIQEATVDGHGTEEEESVLSMETPVKRARARPVSEQLLGRSRPKAIYEGDDATNDLAQLINRLDLEATPGTPDTTPMSQRSPFLPGRQNGAIPAKNRLTLESPIKGLRANTISVTSLRPYARSSSQNAGVRIGQNIAPWSMLNAGISPSKPSPATVRVRSDENTPTLRSKHKPVMSPAPAADPSPVFKPLRPATSQFPISIKANNASSSISPFVLGMTDRDRSPSSLTFGSPHSKSDSHGSLSGSPVFKKAHGHARKRSALVPIERVRPITHPDKALDSPSLPIPPEARRNLGLTGTMGGSIGSTAEQEYDASDPDSDIPDELQVILSSSDQDDTMSLDPNAVNPPLLSPGLPPVTALPVPDSPSEQGSVVNVPIFRATLIDEDDHHADVEEAGAFSEDDTKKSFDFTGELQKLNESGGSDRLSFIEQLETAFRTPAKIDLRYDIGNFLSADVPPVPKLPTLQDELSRIDGNSFSLPLDYESRELSATGFPIDVNAEPSLLPGTDSFATNTSDDELLELVAPRVLRNTTSVSSRPSDGQLNRHFKFGGKPSPAAADKEVAPKASLTLSDIIPPSEIARSLSTASLSGDESALLKSIFAKAVEIPSPCPRPRLDSDSSSKRGARDIARSSVISSHARNSMVSNHTRNSSALSFAGFDSFAEVRRGFEFSDDRPGFYPPPGASSDKQHGRHESIFSIASVSSYGHILNGGSADPFDYGAIVPLASLRERPSSDDFSFSMSTSVDDTFSFIHKQPHRRRVDSDASSFYFRDSAHPYNRSHRRHESNASVASLGPPVSLYNRSFGHHRRGDSSTSMSSIAQSYAVCGANGGRAAWAKHRPNFSVDSVLSDFSGRYLVRPGLGDKMLDSALDRGMPLTAISASPPESLAGSLRSERIHSEEYENPTSYDSLMDSRYGLHKSAPEDSLFEKTDYRTSVSSSDSGFFGQNLGDTANVKNPPRYRPISSLSIASIHSPPNEDDTMISMLGGGHVRRQSIGSMIGGSPCVRVERRKNIVTDPPETVFSRIKNVRPDDYESPEKSRVIESKPSIASTLNSKFGDERMIRAKHGLLERQSLENTVLVAEGEDHSASFRMPVFTRPTRVTRSRSSTCTSSSGVETPPLSISDGYSSFSDGSQSSIDLSQVNLMLSNVTHPLSNAAFDRVRPRARGHGHRRRISQARASRTSIYETIEEEMTSSFSPMNSPEHSAPGSATKTVKVPLSAINTMGPPRVFVVDPETSSVDSLSMWDDESGITALRKYYALRDEAQDTVTESKRVWLDTPFSIFAVQSFDPPHHPSGMQALLEHSLQNYGPLPSELRPRRMRSRVESRPSPYPRTIKTSFSMSPATEHFRAAVASCVATSTNSPAPHQPALSKALQQVTVDSNVAPTFLNAGEKPTESKAFAISPVKPEVVFGLPPRPRVGSTARRVALGWAKRSAGRNGFENKENNTSLGNVSVGRGNATQGTVMTCVSFVGCNVLVII
ncbi:hypothetical protein PAXRUDRAFT_725108 [Paxillus rubicundulus Ve08.2h10]|uniref:Uncharacterized protein n=1 Tax=Paxillus rubicundulus Ve08.2h10 TaxID=930991 RepID=A0A0D0EBS0_9AGAM|nr:hypothetical protein PAXRUDRAFT_725108 [Paxillus rubicundulus Ve08.2h10]